MKKQILIVDAYNMIGHWPELEKLKKDDRLEEAQHKLLHTLSDYQKQGDTEIIVVFDAMYVAGITKSYEQYGLKIVWTDEGQTADTYIEALARKLQSRLTQVTVATSDGAEQWTIFSQGALRKPAWELYQDIKQAKQAVHIATREYQDQALVRRSPFSSEQLDKLAQLRDDLSND